MGMSHDPTVPGMVHHASPNRPRRLSAKAIAFQHHQTWNKLKGNKSEPSNLVPTFTNDCRCYWAATANFRSFLGYFLASKSRGSLWQTSKERVLALPPWEGLCQACEGLGLSKRYCNDTVLHLVPPLSHQPGLLPPRWWIWSPCTRDAHRKTCHQCLGVFNSNLQPDWITLLVDFMGSNDLTTYHYRILWSLPL